MSDMFVTKVAGDGKNRKMVDSWSTSANQVKSDLWSTLSQSIADDIDKEILDDMLDRLVIKAYFHQTPKKGDLVRWGNDYVATDAASSTPPEYIQHGLCTEAYDYESKTDGQILFEDGVVRNFRPVEDTKFSWLEVIDEQ